MPAAHAEPFRLDGDVAIVTGGARGLGRAIAEALADRGATVAIVDLLDDAAEATAAAIRSAGGRAEARHLDVGDEAMIETVFGAVAETHGRIDVLVNNAGIGLRKPAVTIPRSDWDRVVDINMTAVFLCARVAARHMIAGGGGRIVNIASIMGLAGSKYPNISYQTAKGGVVNMTRGLATEWAADGVTVNAVAPTYVKTDLTAPMQEEWIRDFDRMAPLGGRARAEDIANAVLYLASREAGMVTGHILPVDGGMMAR
jgi:NAD(P)-dependent dehydrogenase (short-subunit alcohol dehydrogenase family)